MMDDPTHERSSTASDPTAGSVQRTSESRGRLVIAVSPRATQSCTLRPVRRGAPPATQSCPNAHPPIQNISGSAPSSGPPTELVDAPPTMYTAVCTCLQLIVHRLQSVKRLGGITIGWDWTLGFSYCCVSYNPHWLLRFVVASALLRCRGICRARLSYKSSRTNSPARCLSTRLR